MSEEEAISICKNIIRSINGDTCYMNYSKEQDKEAIETILDLYNKQKEEIERLKNDKKKALNYINQEMYVDTNPTICEMEDEENSIIELPISLNLYNEDLRKLFDLLEEE